MKILVKSSFTYVLYSFVYFINIKPVSLFKYIIILDIYFTSFFNFCFPLAYLIAWGAIYCISLLSRSSRASVGRFVKVPSESETSLFLASSSSESAGIVCSSGTWLMRLCLTSSALRPCRSPKSGGNSLSPLCDRTSSSRALRAHYKYFCDNRAILQCW